MMKIINWGLYVLVNMDNFNRELGKKISEKYLENLPELREHSAKVAELCYMMANQILSKNPELKNEIDPELMGFLGYVHNIGTKLKREKHELHTIYLLTKKEQIPESIAVKTRHGQLVEDYIEDHENYYPIGIEGILLTYIDISVRDGEILPIQERVQEMEQLMHEQKNVFKDYTPEMIQHFKRAIPRYLRYEKIIKSLID